VLLLLLRLLLLGCLERLLAGLLHDCVAALLFVQLCVRLSVFVFGVGETCSLLCTLDTVLLICFSASC
jgi:hypothetical protein